MEAPKASSLSPDQMERLCEIAEEAARNYILSKASRREISDLDITVESGKKKDNLVVDVDVDVRLSPLLRDLDAKKLAAEAVDAAFESVEKFLRETQCHSEK